MWVYLIRAARADAAGASAPRAECRGTGRVDFRLGASRPPSAGTKHSYPYDLHRPLRELCRVGALIDTPLEGDVLYASSRPFDGVPQPGIRSTSRRVSQRDAPVELGPFGRRALPQETRAAESSRLDGRAASGRLGYYQTGTPGGYGRSI
jgi:hypothetical protein